MTTIEASMRKKDKSECTYDYNQEEDPRVVSLVHGVVCWEGESSVDGREMPAQQAGPVDALAFGCAETLNLCVLDCLQAGE